MILKENNNANNYFPESIQTFIQILATYIILSKFFILTLYQWKKKTLKITTLRTFTEL